MFGEKLVFLVFPLMEFLNIKGGRRGRGEDGGDLNKMFGKSFNAVIRKLLHNPKCIPNFRVMDGNSARR